MRRSPVSHLFVLFAFAFAILLMPLGVSATSLQEEIDLGKKLDGQILKETPLSTDTEATRQMEEMGQKLVQGVNRKEITYHFRIIQDNDFNAFSIPGGYVYFTERIWDVLNKDERAGVLAHEIVHVDRRHALDAMSKAQRRQIWLAVLLTAVGANQTLGNLADVAHSLYTLKYSRGDEKQADEVGMQLCINAGYSPAGILLAMRKINRFQSEQGGQPPKIFSSHPPTPERLRYLEEDLRKMGVQVPPETVGEKRSPYKIGEVTAVDSGKIQLRASKPLKPGDILWVMSQGWDYHYENHASVPAARAEVRTSGTDVSANVWMIPGASATKLKKGMEVHDVPAPKGAQADGSLAPAPVGTTSPSLSLSSKPVRFERLMAVNEVWNRDFTQLENNNVGYLVITNPDSPTGYISTQRPKFSYAPISTGAQVTRLQDPDAKRWAGIVASTGKRGGTIELMPSRPLPASSVQPARFDIAYPLWDSKKPFKDRVVATAVLKSSDGKVVLQVDSFAPGWDISLIENGFDVYEAPAK